MRSLLENGGVVIIKPLQSIPGKNTSLGAYPKRLAMSIIARKRARAPTIKSLTEIGH
jgi:hypothetical protein